MVVVVTETVGACALVMVAYMATRPRRSVPQWMAAPVAFSATPAVDVVRTRIRHVGDRLPVRKHDGSGRTYGDRDVVMPPRLPDPTPDLDPLPSIVDGDEISRYLDEVQARLHVALDAEYVALCAALQVPVAVPNTVKPKARKGKRNHGAAQEARRLPGNDAGGSRPHRGSRRVRGGVKVR